MKHEDALLLLDEFAADELSEDIASDVAEHVASCEACRSILDIASGLRGGKARIGLEHDAEHPSADDLVNFGSADGTLSPTRTAEIKDHLRTCSTCRHDVQLVRDALGGQDQGRARRWALPLALVALLFAIFVPVARFIEGRSAQSLNAGPVTILYLPEPTRETGMDMPSITLIQEQDVIPIIVKWDTSWNTRQLLAAVARTGEAEPMLSFPIDPAGHEAALGILMLSIPAASLPAADYRLSMCDAATGKVLADWAFRVATVH